MYKCLECKTVYKNKVEYCNCGNNSFEEIPDLPQPQPQKQKVKEEPVNDEPVRMVTVQQVASYLIFGACCVFSFLFVMFVGPAPEKKVEKPKVEEKVEKVEIPSIDEIWNDTPAYTVHANVSMDSYKSDLKDTLIENFKLPKFDGDGSCEVEFTVDSAGRLRDKKLIRNTANKPLENSAKKMLSAVKIVTPPPITYDDTPFRLEFYEYNNEYQLRYVE